MSVTYLANAQRDNRLWDVPTMLDDARASNLSGEMPGDAAMVLVLDTSDEGYRASYCVANLSSSQMLALLEVVKARVLENM